MKHLLKLLSRKGGHIRKSLMNEVKETKTRGTTCYKTRSWKDLQNVVREMNKHI